MVDTVALIGKLYLDNLISPDKRTYLIRHRKSK